MNRRRNFEILIDLVGLWILFIVFGIIWYKIDRQEDLTRRILYYFNFFIIFVSLLLFTFWIQDGFASIHLTIINIFAITALIIHKIVKKPIKTRILALWTIFLLMTFITLIIRIEFFQPNEVWILLIPSGVYLIFAIIYTVFYGLSKE